MPPGRRERRADLGRPPVSDWKATPLPDWKGILNVSLLIPILPVIVVIVIVSPLSRHPTVRDADIERPIEPEA